MLLSLLMLMTDAAHAGTTPLLLPDPCPKCLKLNDLDGVISPPWWLEETARDLAPFGLNSLVVHVAVHQGSIVVEVDGVQLNEKNFVGYASDGRTMVYQIPVPRTEFKITALSTGEVDAGYDVEVYGSSLDLR